jgi:hypothetical protein
MTGALSAWSGMAHGEAEAKQEVHNCRAFLRLG